ncbi:hypothetical protein CXB51_025406 [Gossypium anomalum]|uniref:Protein kinase domain-containing protein n=1 Tax=Gossypium anomalum TaxID=47600 RepID=A0A8J5YDY4_9ROSI|nr:hypothetical protein CXB51_025406 [Gossypium anomalum]
MATSVAAQEKPRCQSKCGNISIPYPFSTSNGCYISRDFFINCDTSFNPPKAFLSPSILQVLNIYPDDGSLRIQYDRSVGYDCFNSSGRTSFRNPSIYHPKFFISHTRNKFTAIGCDTTASIILTRRSFVGCLTTCGKVSDVIDGSCSGIGCCQAAIPKGLRTYYFSFLGSGNHSRVLTFNPCSYGFLVEDGAYNFSTSHLSNPDFNKKEYPLILDWTIGKKIVKKLKWTQKIMLARKIVLVEIQKVALDIGASVMMVFRVTLISPTAAKVKISNINECETLNPCKEGVKCNNTFGGYNCPCPEGFEGDGRRKGTGCNAKSPQPHREKFPVLVALGICLSIGLLFLIAGAWWFCKILQKRKYIKLKQNFFERNGGLLFQKKMSSNEGGLDKAKLFSSRELEIATDQYNENRILGCGGQGVVYKGMLSDGRIVAVKKSKTVNEGYLEQFINEIFILSQIDHRNIVKLLGCCLETEVPLLVYEFIPNGTLFHLIHDQNEEYPRSWDIRLRIAAEVASAISYLHSSASIPIYHRDIKSSNILLDEKFRAKVSDFGTSRSISIDQTHLTTQVLGTFGYLDREYFQSSQFSEKSDVYSFGVVIVELLTGKKAVSTFGSQEKRGLVSYFMSSMEENHLLDIVDAEIGKDDQKDEVVAVAEIAKRCLNLDGRYRPTMKEVAMELERLRTRQGDCVPVDQLKQAEVVVRKSAESWDFTSFSTEQYPNCSITSTSKSYSLQDL